MSRDNELGQGGTRGDVIRERRNSAISEFADRADHLHPLPHPHLVAALVQRGPKTYRGAAITGAPIRPYRQPRHRLMRPRGLAFTNNVPKAPIKRLPDNQRKTP